MRMPLLSQEVRGTDALKKCVLSSRSSLLTRSKQHTDLGLPLAGSASCSSSRTRRARSSTCLRRRRERAALCRFTSSQSNPVVPCALSGSMRASWYRQACRKKLSTRLNASSPPSSSALPSPSSLSRSPPPHIAQPAPDCSPCPTTLQLKNVAQRLLPARPSSSPRARSDSTASRVPPRARAASCPTVRPRALSSMLSDC